MTRRFSMILGAMAVTMAPMVAQAQGMGMLPSFEVLDSDQTGSVTLEDFKALGGVQGLRQEQIIARLMEQADEDGRLDEAALRAGMVALEDDRRAQIEARRQDRRAQMMERLFARIDSNNDGEISSEEYEAFAGRMAERMDRGERRGMRERKYYGGRW